MPEQRDRSHRPIGEELKRVWAERAQREAAEEAARKEAQQIVERWNRALAAGRGELWSPTIRAAVLAGMPWLDVYCPACCTGRALDIRRPAGIGGQPRGGPAMLLVPRIGAHASSEGSASPAIGREAERHVERLRKEQQAESDPDSGCPNECIDYGHSDCISDVGDPQCATTIG
jgi:hypothetical protein